MSNITSNIGTLSPGANVSTTNSQKQPGTPDRSDLDDVGPPEISAEAVARLYNAKIPNDSEVADVAPWIAFIENEAEGIAANWLDADD